MPHRAVIACALSVSRDATFSRVDERSYAAAMSEPGVPDLSHLMRTVERWAPALAIPTFLGLPVLIAFLVSQATSFGRHVTPAYLDVVAQVLPVVFLAAVIEARALAITAVARMPRGPLLWSLWSFPALFLEAEGVALYAVGEHSHPTTFLVMLPVIIAAWMVTSMFADMAAAIGLSPELGETYTRRLTRVERMAERAVARRQARAANDDATRVRLASTSESVAATDETESLPGAARQLDGPPDGDDSGKP